MGRRRHGVAFTSPSRRWPDRRVGRDGACDDRGPLVLGHGLRLPGDHRPVQLGAGRRKVKRLTRSERGSFAVANVEPKRKVAEFRVSPDNMIDVGAEITANHFIEGQFVDVSGTSIGKGFAGGMKRHKFSGLRASHGVSVSHRSLGSTGQRQDPGKTFKNKKMAGHMGDKQRTQQNLEVVRTDATRGLIFVKGSVPGSKNAWLLVRDAVKLARFMALLPFVNN